MKFDVRLVLLSFILFSSTVYAQQGGFGAGVSVLAQFPSGDFENSAGAGYGVMGGIEMGGDNIHLTARSGYIKHLERGDREIHFIPIFGGIKAATGDGGIFIAGEVGPVLTDFKYKGSLLPGEDIHENNLGWGISIGSAAGPFDIRMLFNAWDARHVGRTMTVGLAFGFTAWGY